MPERSEVVLAVAEQPISAPIFVAAARGLFREQGLDVDLVPRPTGETALREVVEGRAHYATTAETPVVHAALAGDTVVVLATVASTRRGLVVLARADRGVTSPSDLRGRRVGVTLDTNAEFFLDLFLTLHGVRRDSLDVVPVSPEELVPTLTEGRVDALVGWEPHQTEMRNRLGPRLRTFAAPSIYIWFWNVVSSGDFSDAHPRTSRALLRALRDAGRFIVEQPAESRAIVSERLGLGTEELESAWRETSFILSLDQALIESMEDQAVWILGGSTGPMMDLPNVLDFIDAGPLLEVAPPAVSILGRRASP